MIVVKAVYSMRLTNNIHLQEQKEIIDEMISQGQSS